MIRIIGAGFSGLSLAYHFTKRGFPVTVVEKRDRAGGVIESAFQNEMLVESAANGMLASMKIEQMFQDIGIVPLQTKKESRNKFIYRNGLRRWPLSRFETLKMIIKFLIAVLTKSRRPKSGETLKAWADRVVTPACADYLVQPAVNGIFAQRVELLDAEMALNSLFYPRVPGYSKGLISAAGGMGEVIAKLQTYLVSKGVRFEYKTEEKIELKTLQHNTFLAIDLFSLRKLVTPSSPFESVNKKMGPHSLSLVRITLNFIETEDEIQGFGILFPNVEKFNALGVLANTKIFSDRGNYNESWIFSNSTAEDLMSWTDNMFIQKISDDRKRIFKTNFRIKDFVIHRWPNVIPDYGLDLKNFLDQNSSLTDRLAGNYLGVLGLTGIHERNFEIVKKFSEKNKAVL